jgi:hypothetical protein
MKNWVIDTLSYLVGFGKSLCLSLIVDSVSLMIWKFFLAADHRVPSLVFTPLFFSVLTKLEADLGATDGVKLPKASLTCYITLSNYKI